jgi:glycosyltransferase involved in cell wall biosynthesis
MRIAVVTHTTAGQGGIERVVEHQVAGLRRRGHTVRLVSGPAIGSGWLARAFAAGALAFLPASRLRAFDVVLAHYQPAPLVAARSGRPFVAYLHHPMRAAHPTPGQRDLRLTRLWNLFGRRLAGIDRRSLEKAVVVAVPSEKVLLDAKELYGLSAELLPLGVDTSVFTPGTSSRSGLLFVGRAEERSKHLDWAFEVARRLCRPIDVVGRAQPVQVPGVDVTWRGYLEGPALADAYRGAELLLFPAVDEAFGLVPLEALACGLPVIAWDDGNGPSMTLREGSGGVLVPAYDLDAFTDMAAEVLADPDRHTALASAGPAWVAERFSADRHVDRLMELLEQAARTSK